MQAVSEKRDDRRHGTDMSGKVIIDDSLVIDVAVRDLSEGGARLQVATSDNFPGIFQLQIGADSLPVPVRKCWQSADRIGVQFLTPERAAELQHDVSQPSPALVANSRQHDSAAAGAVQSSLLAVEYKLEFEELPSHFGSSCCVVHVGLRNHSEFRAVHPFVCLPALGFDLRPAAGWVAGDMIAVRKTVRLGCADELILAKGIPVDCCSIILPFRPENGGYLRYAADVERPLAQLADLRLSCQVGAANFPADRVPLTIPASHIAGVILDSWGLDGEPRKVVA